MNPVADWFEIAGMAVIAFGAIYLLIGLLIGSSYQSGLRAGYEQGRKEAAALQQNVSTEGKWF